MMLVKKESFTFLAILLVCLTTTSSLQIHRSMKLRTTVFPDYGAFISTRLYEDKRDGVVELVDEEEENTPRAVAPFMSQGEIPEERTEMDLSDPKQARVMFYIILSLLPVLFLIPLMLGSREMIPAEMLPPVELN